MEWGDVVMNFWIVGIGFDMGGGSARHVPEIAGAHASHRIRCFRLREQRTLHD